MKTHYGLFPGIYGGDHGYVSTPAHWITIKYEILIPKGQDQYGVLSTSAHVNQYSVIIYLVYSFSIRKLFKQVFQNRNNFFLTYSLQYL